jgi:hypothetical protein
VALIGTALLAIPCGGRAQEVAIEPLIVAREGTSILVRGAAVVAGLESGGVVVWDRAEPERPPRRLQAGAELSFNRITDLADSGRNIWVATDGGGLTRIGNLDGEWDFRQFSTNLAGLDLTAVAGALVGDNEWVFYALDGAGVGRITNGVPGTVYTADQDGLISDTVNDLAFIGDELFVATPIGISRFANNVFRDANAGLTATAVNALAVSPAGELYAGTGGGVFRYDPGGETWSSWGGLASAVLALAAANDTVWALGRDAEDRSVLTRLTGAGAEAVALPEPYTNAIAATPGVVWTTGRHNDADMKATSGLAFLARRRDELGQSWLVDASLVRNVDGVAFSPNGDVWLGSRDGEALARWNGDQWLNLYRLGTAENDSNGLYNHAGGMLAVGTERSGEVWFGQFARGLIRYDPVSGDFDWVNPDNSPLQGIWVERAITHPLGPLFFVSASHAADLLIDPDAWRDPNNWLNFDSGTLGGLNVRDVLVERNDVIWFAVWDVGLLRWDVNGDDAGPADALTWRDASDDRWDGPLTTLGGFDPLAVSALALARDGTIWAGGAGVGRFTYTVTRDTLTAELLESYGEKTGSFVTGLLAQGVVDIQVDRNDDLWAWTSAGLNRVRSRGATVVIDAYTDLLTYVNNPQFAAIYSPNIITALPGGESYKLAVSDDGSRLVTGSSNGSALIAVASTTEEQTAVLEGVFFYPNPFPGEGGDGKLRIGGIAADETMDDPATVEIFNLEGQLVFRDRFVSADRGFWDGRNRYGDRVASGLYLAKVSYRGAVAVKTVAVER